MQRILSFVLLILAASASSKFTFVNTEHHQFLQETPKLTERSTFYLKAHEQERISNSSEGQLLMFFCGVLQIDGAKSATILAKSFNGTAYYGFLPLDKPQEIQLTESQGLTLFVPAGVAVDLLNESNNDVTVQCEVTITH